MSESKAHPLRVLHLIGSEVSDFFGDLSRLYAGDCLQATADPERYDARIAHVSPGHAPGSAAVWRFPDSLAPEAVAAAPPRTLAQALVELAALDLDVMVPQMFCLPGMTTYRSLFDLLGVPYVGNTPATMALGAHKGRAKAVVAAAGVRVPLGQTLRAGEEPWVRLPAVVKPVDADNSVGVALVREADRYDECLAEAFVHGDEVLVEEYVELGREVRCGVLEIDGELVCLPLEEYAVDPDTKPIRDADDKLRRGDDDALGLVAKDADHAWIVADRDPVVARVHAAARACHRALGCRDYGLFDFRIDPEGQPWFLEAGLYCSFAEQSVISVMAAAAGTALPDLFATALDQAVARGITTSEESS